MLTENIKIKSEVVILFVGKQKELTYQYVIPKDKIKLEIKDFYKNESYIVDPIGEVVLISQNKTIEKNYLYWIATSNAVDMTHENLEQIDQMSYASYLDDLQKYHYKKLWFRLDSDHQVELVKEKLIK